MRACTTRGGIFLNYVTLYGEDTAQRLSIGILNG